MHLFQKMYFGQTFSKSRTKSTHHRLGSCQFHRVWQSSPKQSTESSLSTLSWLKCLPERFFKQLLKKKKGKSLKWAEFFVQAAFPSVNGSVVDKWCRSPLYKHLAQMELCCWEGRSSQPVIIQDRTQFDSDSISRVGKWSMPSSSRR